MARLLVPDALWAKLAPLFPPSPPRPKGGRPAIPDRAALTGVLFVLRTGLPWEELPAEMGCGSGMSCWRRLRRWQAAGAWPVLRATLLAGMHGAEALDWRRLDGDAGGRAGRRRRDARASAKAGAGTT